MPASARKLQPTFRHSGRIEHVPGQLIVRFREGAIPTPGPRSLASATHMAHAVSQMPEAVSGPLEYLRSGFGLKEVRPLFSAPPRAGMKLAGVKSGASKAALVMSVAASPSEQLRGFTTLSVDPKRVTPQLLKDLAASKAVEMVERMPARWLSLMPKGGDPMRVSQWNLHAIGWFDKPLPDARSVLVAVLDTGVDTTHPDLRTVLSDYDHGPFSAEDIVGHGTHVSGIIAATVNNNIGISGVARTKIKVWKIFPDKPVDGEYYVDGERYLQALREVEVSGARVLNLSIGGTQHSQTEALLFRRLVAANVTVVAAMGNEYQDGNPVEYPSAYPGVIGVAAVDPRLDRADFSNTGAHAFIAAPGVSILSTLPMKRSSARRQVRYAAWDGTSMATPHVTAGVALLLARHSRLNGSAVRNSLQRSAKRLAGMNGARTKEYGYGLLYLPNLLK
jgi:subtilisin family serine protease